MIDSGKIVASAEAKLSGTEMFVVGCTCSPMNDIELLVDSTGKIGIDDCIALSKAIEADFDREQEDFSLTVASAGIGSDLKDLRQFNKLISRSVEVLLFSGIKYTAKLLAANQEGITISYPEQQIIESTSGKKKKHLVDVEKSFTFEEIKYTREFLDFK